MPSPPREDVLPELARLLNVWIEHDLVVTSATALGHWVRQTAARCSRLPQPTLGLPLLTQLELVHPSPGNEALEPSGELLRHLPERASTLDRYPSALAASVFDRLLRVPEFAGPLLHVLSFISLSGGAITLSWNEVPRREQSNLGWIWLQQLGLMSHVRAGIVFDPTLVPYVLEVPPAKRRMSQAELEERLRRREERAILAEEYVVALERNRLRATGAGSFADEVVRVSIDDVMAGYDIRSYEVTGAIRHIEVKSSAGPRSYFVLSRNEFETAREKGDSYWLAWVEGASRLPEGPCAVAWFRNPAAILARNAGMWEVRDGDLVVHRVSDDSPAQADPRVCSSA